MQHLARLMGRGRALEVIMSAQDYDAELAERHGWINRALPAKELGNFVRSLAHRIARFPAAGVVTVKERVNAITLASVEDRLDGAGAGCHEKYFVPAADRRGDVFLDSPFQRTLGDYSLLSPQVLFRRCVL